MRSSGADRMSGEATVRCRRDIPEVGHHGKNTLSDDVCDTQEDTCRSGIPTKKREIVKKEKKENKQKKP
ncbi:hypothetical protein DPMN_056388 [Dreissena polymorpha]|uniref:Uncharacterized protein n=1 Tax=Dreissena polymorpha TaxID=45954 RepID=A0A9D4CTJ6_DREPO|nr:hypothetical protein DPMN_056388 [Dreissena polymorpha]